ncbi:ParB/RepB/Spo0J family partition protein [Martelella mediterranea]|uniref:Chromosome segregation DNA-binding protein n=1 Tax=Martelella mediterranea TaxID=293089 RepID=A0A4R3NXJ1_9HYPH|nr:ParB/RepB/Spo0J family partition protein [Martelella mediterranea]TCT44686.1 chromosome segregation DNA-binding protein [Martelella mediterranea]
MSEDSSKRRLGRGLAALIGDIDKVDPVDVETVSVSPDRTVPIEFVVRNPRNPRRHFEEEDLRDLAASVRQHGIVQPVVVRTTAEKRFEIIAGERRWRAAQLAGLAEIPVLIRDVDDRTALEIAIVENVQRADLNPLEEANGYELLMAEHGYTQNDLGEIIGKSRSHVANSLRLLKLPDGARRMLAEGALSAGHARALISTPDPDSLAQIIVDKGLSVRDAEKLAQKAMEGGAAKRGRSTANQKDADTLALEKSLSDRLGLSVTIDHKANGGQIRIAYSSLDQLDDVCRRLDRSV